MTRAYVNTRVWEWRCDRCGRHGGELARTQQLLPTPDEMRGRGWYIAPTYGDLCSRCVNGIEDER